MIFLSVAFIYILLCKSNIQPHNRLFCAFKNALSLILKCKSVTQEDCHPVMYIFLQVITCAESNCTDSLISSVSFSSFHLQFIVPSLLTLTIKKRNITNYPDSCFHAYSLELVYTAIIINSLPLPCYLIMLQML
jgi:hypothetical protein